MKNRIARALITASLVSALVVTPVCATSLEDMQAEKARTESEAASLQAELTATLNKIDQLEKDISKKEKQIEKAGEDLEVAAAKQTEQYDSMKLRIKYMYENGDSNLIETIFSAESFSDLINKAEYVSEVHSYDRTKLDEFVETTKKIEKMKEDLEGEYTEMQSMEEDLETERTSLDSTLRSKQAEIATLDHSIQVALEKKRKEEEERKRREEEARRQAEAAQQAIAQQQQAAQTEATSNNNSNNNSNNTSKPEAPAPTVKPQGKNGAAVVAMARQYIGYPYVYAGNSLTGGIDCSGFTQQIYAKFGVSLPRTSYAQANCGYSVPLSQAQAGDLLIYNGHVGIYNGSGGIVHASSPSVGITEFSSCTYRALQDVRRVL